MPACTAKVWPPAHPEGHAQQIFTDLTRQASPVLGTIRVRLARLGRTALTLKSLRIVSSSSGLCAREGSDGCRDHACAARERRDERKGKSAVDCRLVCAKTVPIAQSGNVGRQLMRLISCAHAVGGGESGRAGGHTRQSA